MENRFDFVNKEESIYKNWEEKGYFKPIIDKTKKPFVISMPPPNVTAKLHIGHALDNTIQDIFIRYHRLKGDPTLWVPGTDHASIATEVKVVQKLKAEGKTKDSVGRATFLKEAWDWKNKYGNEITEQLRKMGASCDWSRERFTMDEGCSRAVLETFEKLYNKGLIYKGERIVNWCPDCKTPISETEVEYEEQNSYLWHIKYPIENSDEYVVVATTRPETMLGDTAVAVNPNDDRYKHLVGKRVFLPIVEKYIPIIADRYVELEFGTGVVKMTPAHDPNDFEVGKRHNLEFINILNDDGTLNENAGKYEGLTTLEARKQIEERLNAEGYLLKKEEYTHNVGSCYRCHHTIEPYISNQWFVKMKELVKPAIEAVKTGEVEFVPKRFEKTYFNWMENIQDWCISRQLWWGHRIPAYYCEQCGEIIVSKETITTCKCGGHLTQDEDTLDTWFSSALWPFSILGWPEKTEDLEYFYPNSMLVTAYDIITFWVSKMIFSGIEFTGKPPFKYIFIHGLVRDSQGRKMSKSLGNGVDPIDIINEYGTDALRFSLVQNISLGNDIKYMPEKVEASRNFVNKLWNAARFVNMYLKDLTINDATNLRAEDKWILTKLSSVVAEIEKDMDAFDIGIAMQKIYDFVWSDFCDLYVEMVKPRLYNKEDQSYESAIWTLNYVLLNCIKVLHPFIPYVTEEIYQNLKVNKESIMLEEWPETTYDFAKEANTIENISAMLKQIRNARAEASIESSKKINIKIVIENEETNTIFSQSEAFIKKLGYIETIEHSSNVEEIDKSYSAIHLQEMNVYLDLKSAINIEDEIKKLEEDKKNIIKELNRAKGMLSNEAFLSKAPEALVSKEKEKIEKYSSLLQKIEDRLNDFLNN
ncbi:MAG: valine--tRNA ligase [Clostridia bacterium]|nr:valine--tRNA ligase [Clostridia bacterium]